MISLPGSLFYAFLHGWSPSCVPVRRNNARLSECPSRLLRVLRADRCTKYKDAFALFIPYNSMERYRVVLLTSRWLSITAENAIREKPYFDVDYEILLIRRDEFFHVFQFIYKHNALDIPCYNIYEIFITVVYIAIFYIISYSNETVIKVGFFLNKYNYLYSLYDLILFLMFNSLQSCLICNMKL